MEKKHYLQIYKKELSYAAIIIEIFFVHFLLVFYTAGSDYFQKITSKKY